MVISVLVIHNSKQVNEFEEDLTNQQRDMGIHITYNSSPMLMLRAAVSTVELYDSRDCPLPKSGLVILIPNYSLHVTITSTCSCLYSTRDMIWPWLSTEQLPTTEA